MSANTESKNAILDQFSASAHVLADEATKTFKRMSYAIAGVVLVIALLITIIVCAIVYSYGTYTVAQIIVAGIVTMMIVLVSLGIIVESSTVSASRKTHRLADNATNVVSSQQATDILNQLSTIYLNNS